jgi:hypothetical protein
MALERGSGRDAVPVASSVTAIAAAVFAVVAALTFGSGLDHLVSTPHVTGVNWDVLFFWPDDGEGERTDRALIEAAFADDDRVAAFESGVFFSPFPLGRQLELGPERLAVGMLAFGDGPIEPSVIHGRAPKAAHEVLLGPETAEQLGVDVGDSVEGRGQAGTWDEPGDDTIAQLDVVGIGVIPNEGGSGRLGRGAALSVAGVQALNPAATPDGWWLRFADGADPAAVVDGLLDRLDVTPGEADLPFLPPEAFLVGGTRDLQQVDRVPQLLAALMGLMTLGVIAHVLVLSMRANGRDLAVLRGFGFRRRDVGRTMAWQSVAFMTVALVIGVPLGVVVGRLIWLAYATRLGAVPEAVIPWWSLIAVVAVAFTVGILIALVLSWRATRTSVATVLRTE